MHNNFMLLRLQWHRYFCVGMGYIVRLLYEKLGSVIPNRKSVIEGCAAIICLGAWTRLRLYIYSSTITMQELLVFGEPKSTGSCISR